MARSEKSGLRFSPHPYAFTTSVFWSLAYVLTRFCSHYLPTSQISFLRCLVASLTMLTVIRIKKIPLPGPKDLLWFALTGFVGFGAYMLIFNKGCSMVTTATGNVVMATAPIVTAVGARALLHERLKNVQWCGIAVAFVGVIILTVLSGGFSVNIGLLWLMCAMLLMSAYNLLQRFLSRRFDSLTITAYSILFGTLYLCVFAPAAFRNVGSAPAKVWLLLIILGTCCSGVAYVTWARAFSLAKNASTVSNYMSVNPFISTIFGCIFIGDLIETSAIYGGAVIMLGLAMFNFAPGLPERRKESASDRDRE